MGDKRSNKDIINQEKVFRAIAQQGQEDIDTIKERLRKNKVVESRTKITTAINDLIKSGRLILKGKMLSINQAEIKHGKLIKSNGSSFIIIDGDTHQYYIDEKDSKGYNSNSKIEIGYYNRVIHGEIHKTPFIIKLEHEKEKSQSKEQVLPENSSQNSLIVYGRVMKSSHDELVFLPNDKKRFKYPIFIANEKKTLAKYQDKICTMRIVVNETEDKEAIGVLEEIKGDAGNPIEEYDAIAESHGANMNFSDEKVQKEIEKIPTEVDLTNYQLISLNSSSTLTKSDKPQLIDLRDINFTTTDPADCKDMDDAIYSEFDKEGNLEIYVAVANVTKYVKLNSEIGRRYIQAGFTTYAPNKAYNILPPQLSTNICSLNPNVDRLALVIKTTVDTKTGRPISSSIMDAVINSKEKFSYEQAQEIVDSNKDITEKLLQEKFKQGIPLTREEQVVMNKFASDILWQGLNRRNLLQFDSDNEYDVKFNNDMSDILDICKQPHIPYHKVIEAFMVTANEASAEFALKNNIPNIYRVHEQPNESKLDQAFEFFGYLDIPFDGDLSPVSIRNIVSSVKGTDKEKLVNNFLIRMQSKAKYCNTINPNDVKVIGRPSRKHFKTQPNQIEDIKIDFERGREVNKSGNIMQDEISRLEKNISHFGLQSEHYSHTTSPIRRITDYVTHYNILNYLHGKKLLEDQQVRDIALWANQMQDAIDLSEREFNELNSAIYCTHHINDIMKGRICSFRKLVDQSDVSAEDIVVIVENEDKGIRVQIPLLDILLNRGGSKKRVAISKYGSAVVNKTTGKPILTVCQDLTFRITESDRVTRQVRGSINLTIENDNTKNKVIQDERILDYPIYTEKTTKNDETKDFMEEGMLKNNKCCKKNYKENEDQIKSGLKFKNEIKFEEFAEDMAQHEVFKTNKSQRKKYKDKKQETIAKGQMKDYYKLENKEFE